MNRTSNHPYHPYADLHSLVTVIARSQIVVVVAEAAAEQSQFPAGFEAVDIAILEWIAREGRWRGRELLRM
ncbi:MAG: hypothetical protein WBF58_08235 [Xanthobacteraceae bacterium]